MYNSYLKETFGTEHADVSGAKPVPAIFFVVLLFGFGGLLVVAECDICASNVNFAAWVGSVFDCIVALVPRDEFDVAASERASGCAFK